MLLPVCQLGRLAMLKMAKSFKQFSRQLSKYESVLESEVKSSLKQSLQDTQTHAAQNHRYQSRSGMLNKSYEKVVYSPFKGELFLVKDNNVPYAHAIHSGRKDWRNYRPDRFLTDAGKSSRVKSKVKKNFNDAVKEATRKVF